MTEVDEVAPGWIVRVRGLLTEPDCAALIARAEASGFPPATIAGERRAEVRNNDRRTLDDPALAADLWTRIAPFVPMLPDATATGLNERMRFDRYQPGHRVAAHVDVPYHRSEVEQSRFTMLVYLNDGFDGGETWFRRMPIHPELGSALLFRHELEHEGAEVRRGVKYLLRTDVMYRTAR
jgi:prolyl 4-hydroxylase